MRALRVMHILSDFGLGGAQQVVLDVVSNLDRARFKPRVVCLRGGGAMVSRLEERNVPHSIAFFNSRLSLLGLWRLRGILRELEIDVVHTHLRRANLSGRLAAVWAGTPVIIAHGHDTFGYKKPLHKRLDRWLAKRTDRFLCASNAVADAHAANSGLPRSFYTTFYNFLNPDDYRDPMSPQLAKADINVPVEEPCVGIVGRLHPVKGHDLFLDMALRLNQERPDLHFAIVGDGDRKEELRDRVRRMGMAHKVNFVGFSHEMGRVYRALDVVTLCSESEGLGKVILEAQSAGVPVVAKSVGGVPEALAGGGGILVENANEEKMAAAVLESLKPATARMLRGQMERNLQRFNAARQITELEDIYEELAQAKNLL